MRISLDLSTETNQVFNRDFYHLPTINSNPQKEPNNPNTNFFNPLQVENSCKTCETDKENLDKNVASLKTQNCPQIHTLNNLNKFF